MSIIAWIVLPRFSINADSFIVAVLIFTVVEVLGRTGTELRVRGLDMLDGTPILDIKPYMSAGIPAEKLRRGWLEEAEARKAAKSAE